MWAIAWPFFLAAWMFLFAVFASMPSYFGRKDAGTAVGTDRLLWRTVQRGLRWVFYLSVGFGGLILVLSLPSWFYWGQLHVRGVPVNAKILSRSLELDDENRQFTRVTYEFEAKVDGQDRLFQRQGDLRGWHFPAGYIPVLHDPTDPSDSRMTLEAGNARDVLLSLASFLVIGVASFLLWRRSRHAGTNAVSARDDVPTADGTGDGRRRV